MQFMNFSQKSYIVDLSVVNLKQIKSIHDVLLINHVGLSQNRYQNYLILLVTVKY